MKVNTADSVPLSVSPSYQRHRLEVPETDGSVLAATRQQELVRVERHVRYGPSVAGKLSNLLAGPQVPDLDDSFPLLPSTRYPLAVWTELDAVNLGGVTFVRKDAALPPGVPQSEAGVRAATAEKVSVRVEINALDSTFVTSQSSEQLGGLQVPDLESSGLAAGADQLLSRAKPDALNASVVTWKREKDVSQTISISLDRPDRLMIQLGFPTAQRLTFLSSPPVTRTRPLLCPRERQVTLAAWPTNSCSFHALFGPD